MLNSIKFLIVNVIYIEFLNYLVTVIYISSLFSPLFFLKKKKDKQPLLSLFLKVLGGGNREADNKVINNKVVYSKNIDNKKASSKKISGFLVDFALSLLSSSTKLYKERFNIYFLKLY